MISIHEFSFIRVLIVFLMFTPFTFIFLFFYFLVLFYTLSLTSFVFFWLYIEILMLIFIGISYTLYTNRFTQLIFYFLIQTLASFGILAFHILSFDLLSILSVFIKLGLFPFFSWYLNVLLRFPNFIFFLSCTFHKLPPLIILLFLFSPYSLITSLLCVVLTTAIMGCYMLSLSDIRYLIVPSSVSNGSFFVLGVYSGDTFSFYLYFMVYTLTLYIFISILSSFTKLRSPWLNSSSSLTIISFLLLCNIASIPPMPNFLAKFYLLYSFSSVESASLYLLLLLVLFNCLVILSYFKVFSPYMVHKYSSSLTSL